MLVKVFNRLESPPGLGRLRTRQQERRHLGSFLSGFTRELREYAASRFEPGDPLITHLPTLFGIVDTDMGPGLIVGAALGRDGNLGATLLELAREGRVTREHLALLEELFRHFMSSGLVIGDLTARNLVLEQLPDGTERFVLVDGLGDKTLLPVQRWVPWFNQLCKWRRIVRLRKRLASNYYARAAAKTAGPFKNPIAG